MNEKITLNPAELAAEQALETICNCIDERKSFILEAGAGAGKTYSLVYALNYLIDNEGQKLLRQHQRIACISYTNVASDEIKSRTDGHPAILSSTIHAFCWSLIKDFQPFLQENLFKVSRWEKLLDEVGGMSNQKIVYTLGYQNIDDREISLGHNDVLSLTVLLLEKKKFCKLLVARFPVLFIDEYQDTNKDLAAAILAQLLPMEQGPLIGLFGDHWQKIYGDGCGKIENDFLEMIPKRSNFRSVRTIVDILNNMRPELPQEVKDPEIEGFAAVYHTNLYAGQRQTGDHWKDDLPSEAAHSYLEIVKAELSQHHGWDFESEETKILMLTHRVLAIEQGYDGIASVFTRSESYAKKEDPHIEFFIDAIEPVCVAFDNKQYGNMFLALGDNIPYLRSSSDKSKFAQDMEELSKLRQTGTIGEVIDHLRQKKYLRLPDIVEQREYELESESSNLEYLSNLRNVPYREVIVLKKYLDKHTPFSTKHGVKGAQFENVLVVFGGGWNQYNFNEFLEWASTGVPANKQSKFERNRNLFYVTCSRPKSKLALLFTQKLSSQSLMTLSNWFGEEFVHGLDPLESGS